MEVSANTQCVLSCFYSFSVASLSHLELPSSNIDLSPYAPILDNKMKLRRVLAALVLILMVGFLIILAVFDILKTVDASKTLQSQIEFRSLIGNRSTSLFVLHLAVDGYSQEFEHLCQCRIIRLDDPKFSIPCWTTAYSQFGHFFSIIQPSRGIHVLHTLFYEVDISRKRKEVLKVNCTHPDFPRLPVFISTVLSMSAEDIQTLMRNPDPDYVFEFYKSFMANHRFFLSPSGSYNRLLLTRRVLQKYGADVTFLNTYTDKQYSSTRSASVDYTEFDIAWDSDIFLHAKELKVVKPLGIVRLIATMLLAAERMSAIYARTIRRIDAENDINQSNVVVDQNVCEISN